MAETNVCVSSWPFPVLLLHNTTSHCALFLRTINAQKSPPNALGPLTDVTCLTAALLFGKVVVCALLCSESTLSCSRQLLFGQQLTITTVSLCVCGVCQHAVLTRAFSERSRHTIGAPTGNSACLDDRQRRTVSATGAASSPGQPNQTCSAARIAPRFLSFCFVSRRRHFKPSSFLP